MNGIDQEIIKYQTLLDYKQKELQDNINKIKSMEEEFRLLNDSMGILSHLVESIISSNTQFIEELVSDGLTFIFGDKFKFEINHNVKNSKNVWYYTIQKGDIKGDINSFGGGVMAVTSFLLRVAINIIKKKPKFMFLDESLNHVSNSYQDKLSEFIKLLCDKFDMTIILITHQEKIISRCDKIINLEEKLKGN